jgi:hypothetical protein
MAKPVDISGFYRATFQSMSFCATTSENAGANQTCGQTDATHVPVAVSEIMTDPVAVSMDSSGTKAYLIPNTLSTDNYFPMQLSSSLALSSPIQSTAKATLWGDPACTTRLRITQGGQIQRKSASFPVESPYGQFDIQGRVQFQITVKNFLEGDCRNTLLALKACYQDVNQCQGSNPDEDLANQTAVKGFLDPYLTAGVTQLESLVDVAVLSWTVQYQ